MTIEEQEVATLAIRKALAHSDPLLAQFKDLLALIRDDESEDLAADCEDDGQPAGVGFYRQGETLYLNGKFFADLRPHGYLGTEIGTWLEDISGAPCKFVYPETARAS